MDFDTTLGIVLTALMLAFNTVIILWCWRNIRNLAAAAPKAETQTPAKEGDDVS